MARILFVDNQEAQYERFLKTPFAKSHPGEADWVRDPLLVVKRLRDEPEIRLVILDMLWEEGGKQKSPPIEMGASVMKEIAEAKTGVPVVIYSVIDRPDMWKKLIPDMMLLGAFDWVSKEDNQHVRSFRFERAYKAGRSTQLELVLPVDADRKAGIHAALLFVDLSGFTELTDKVGQEDTLKILREFYALVGEAVRANHGYVDKYIGDAVMAVFGILDSTAVQADQTLNAGRCIAAARQIATGAKSLRLKHIEPVVHKFFNRGTDNAARIGGVRIGAESGVVDVVRFAKGNSSDVTVIGTPVNIAARIVAQTEAGEIWIGENLYLNGGLAGFVDKKPKKVKYKNLNGTFNAYKVSV